MSRVHAVGAVVVLAGWLAVGCGRKDKPAPEGKAEAQPASAETAKPGPKPGPSSKQPEVISGAYNVFEAKARLLTISIALLSYENAYTYYPAGIVGPDGDLGLSWRVAILPYLDDEMGKLYKEFKLTEAWDSPHNKKLLTKMPAVFATPGTAASEGRTHYRAFAGPNAFIPLPERVPAGTNMAAHWGAKPGQPARGRVGSTITDGRRGTLMVVQSGEPVEWTKPDSLVVTNETVSKLGLYQMDFLAVMCDGSVEVLPKTMTETSLRALVTTNAGDVPGPEVHLFGLTQPKK